jgi:hypothetical protein
VATTGQPNDQPMLVVSVLDHSHGA